MAVLVDEERAELEALAASGRAAWPDLEVAPEVFIEFLAERIRPGTDGEALPIADLYLACACAQGDERAMAALERTTFDAVDAAAAALRAPSGAADEVKQILRTRFFVGSGERPPAIADFGGRGDLHGWVRVSAVREILRLFKRAQRVAPLDEALLAELAPTDPETAALKARCGGELAAAFREAIEALPPRARTLLRYQIADGLGVTEIGAIYHVHRATAARWLAKLREELVEDTRRRLAARLRLSEAEAKSMIRLVQSQLDLSVVGLLAP
jgi:RNA polymerase sigma-70 factor (ECF subfamily)